MTVTTATGMATVVVTNLTHRKQGDISALFFCFVCYNEKKANRMVTHGTTLIET